MHTGPEKLTVIRITHQHDRLDGLSALNVKILVLVSHKLTKLRTSLFFSLSSVIDLKYQTPYSLYDQTQAFNI